MKVRRQAPLHRAKRGALRVSGEAVRYETAVHHERHRVHGSGGLLISPAAKLLWEEGNRCQLLYLVEGLTDFAWVTTTLPEAAVVGIPGTYQGAHYRVLKAVAAWPRRTVLLSQADSPGRWHDARVAGSIKAMGWPKVVSHYPPGNRKDWEGVNTGQIPK